MITGGRHGDHGECDSAAVRQWAMGQTFLDEKHQKTCDFRHSHCVTLWKTNSLLLKIAIEIVDLPIKNGDFP